MSIPATIRVYIDGSTIPYTQFHSDDGSTFSKNIDLPDGEHTIEITAQKVGEQESERTTVRSIAVSDDAAPLITSHSDWDEAKDQTVNLSITVPNTGETVRIFLNDVQVAEISDSNNDGIISYTLTLDYYDVKGIEVYETIRIHRVTANGLSHPIVIRVVPTYSHLAASGVTTQRLLHTALALSYCRYKYPGSFSHEMVHTQSYDTAVNGGHQGQRIVYRASNNLMFGTGNPIPWFMQETGVSDHCGGYISAEFIRNIIDRINSTTTGMTYFNTDIVGGAHSNVPPLWFNFGRYVAMAYYRGDKGAYTAYKGKLIEILNNLYPNFYDASSQTGKLIRQGHYYISRMRHHGFSGIPVDHGASWYAAHNGDTVDLTGIQDIAYWPEMESTIKWVEVLKMLSDIAQREVDTASKTIFDTWITDLKDGISNMLTTSANLVSGANLVKQQKFPYDNYGYASVTGSADGNAGYTATALAIAIDAFNNPSITSTVATAFRNKCSSRSADTKDIYNEFASPLYKGSILYAGNRSSIHDVMQFSGEYHQISGMGTVAYALAQSDASYGRSVAEDIARFSIAWFQNSVINCMGISYHHNMTDGHWGHMGSHWGPASSSAHTWFKEADDRYADLGPIVINSPALNSIGNLATPLGHRITGIVIAAATTGSYSATIQIVAQDANNGISAMTTTVWPPVPTYGTEYIMATIVITGTSASQLTEIKSYANMSGGRIRAKVIALSGSAPSQISVTLKQSRITPTFVEDQMMGFTDNFEINRLAQYDALLGDISGCTITNPYDSVPLNPSGSVNSSPLKRTFLDIATTSGSWLCLIQKNTSFKNGSVSMFQLIGATAKCTVFGGRDVAVTSGGFPSTRLYLRVSADRQNYLMIDGWTDYMGPLEGDLYTRTYHVVEVVGGSVVHNTDVVFDLGISMWYGYGGSDELHFSANIQDSKLEIQAFSGGLTIDVWDGLIGYGAPVKATYTILSSELQISGSVGFGVNGPCKLEAFKCMGQDQPLPPGFILDTGLNIPETESHIPQAHVNGEWILPASNSMCLRNEWGAQVSPIVTGYNARWSY